MKKVYGLLVVLVLFVGCFFIKSAFCEKTMKVFVVEGDEIIRKTKHEICDGKLVPKFIVTNKAVRIYKNGQEVKKIFGNGFYPITCTDNGEYFLCTDGVKHDDRGAPDSGNIKIYNSKGILVWSERVQGMFGRMLITNHDNSWGLFEWSKEDGYARFVKENSENYLIKSYENLESVYDVKIGLSGVIVLSQKTATQKWILGSFDFDGNLLWNREFDAARNGIPILLVNKRGCFVLFPVKDQLCFRGYDESGTLLVDYYQKYGESSYYFRGVINENHVYFSNSNILKRFNIDKKNLEGPIIVNDDVKSLFSTNQSVYVWRKIDDSKDGRKIGVCLDFIRDIFLSKSMTTITLPESYYGTVNNIEEVGNYIVIVQRKRIFVIEKI